MGDVGRLQSEWLERLRSRGTLRFPGSAFENGGRGGRFRVRRFSLGNLLLLPVRVGMSHKWRRTFDGNRRTGVGDLGHRLRSGYGLRFRLLGYDMGFLAIPMPAATG